MLELDTTSPTIEIIVPHFTTLNSPVHITIQANDELGEYQDIYVIDSKGNRFDITLVHGGNKYVSDALSLSECSVGVATIYARLKDDVGNFSNVATKSIYIMSANLLHLKMGHSRMGVKAGNSMRSILTDVGKQRVDYMTEPKY
jgi:hypothetical protein